MEKKKIIHVGILKIDLNCRQVWKNKQLIVLRRKEFALLSLLVEHPGWVYTKEQIYEAIWPKEYFVNIENAVACQIKRLRKKIGNNSIGQPYIETVWGVGYRFNAGPSKTDF